MKKLLNAHSLPRLGLAATLIVLLVCPSRGSLWPVALILAAADIGYEVLSYIKMRWPVPTKELSDVSSELDVLKAEFEKVKGHISSISMQQGIRPAAKSPFSR